KGWMRSIAARVGGCSKSASRSSGWRETICASTSASSRRPGSPSRPPGGPRIQEKAQLSNDLTRVPPPARRNEANVREAPRADETVRIVDEWYVLATSAPTDDRTAVLKHGATFGVFDRFGDIVTMGKGEHGMYHDGTRFLSRLELRLNGQRPMLLHSSVKQDNSLLAVDLTTPDFYEEGRLAVMKGTVHVFRAKLLWQSACHEHLRVVNYGEEPVSLRLSLEFGADYADIF